MLRCARDTHDCAQQEKPWREFSISPALRRAAACSAV
jgi:hypothetical protein